MVCVMGRAMAQAVRRRPASHRGGPRSVQTSPCRVCGEKSGNGTGFSQSTSVSPVSTIPLMFRTH